MRNLIHSAFLLALAGPAFAVSNTFTYQGSLSDAGTPANGTYDLRFALLSDNAPVPPIIVEDVVVTDGVFTVDLDFGSAIDANDFELEVGVRAGSAMGGFTILSPTTPIRPAPQAQIAGLAGEAVSVSPNAVGSAGIADGSIGSADIDSSQIQRRVGSACAASQAIRAINADGTVTCEAAGGGGSVTSVGTGAGLTGGPITGSGTIAIASGGVTSDHIANGSVLAADIDANEVQRRVAGSCPAGSAIRNIDSDGAVACASIPVAGWALTGNSGTNPANHFIGTTDNQPLVLKANSTAALTLSFASNSNNVLGGSSANSIGGSVRGTIVLGGGAIPLSEPGFSPLRTEPNAASGNYATVIGGLSNRAATASYATIVGGITNDVSGESAIVAGGSSNRANALSSAVVGGAQNVTTGLYSIAAGGRANSAHGSYSAAVGGNNNCAGGYASFAAGFGAHVRQATGATGLGACSGVAATGDVDGDEGTFLWADASTTSGFVSTGPNKFEVRASGGYRLVSNALGTSGVTLAAGSGTWTSISDRAMKSNIEPVDPTDVLARVATMPIYTWQYKTQEAGIRHMGPMAQDFHAAFALNGEDDRSIATVDPDGVALAAIQGLNAKLERENAELRARLDAIEAMLKAQPAR